MPMSLDPNVAFSVEDALAIEHSDYVHVYFGNASSHKEHTCILTTLRSIRMNESYLSLVIIMEVLRDVK